MELRTSQILISVFSLSFLLALSAPWGRAAPDLQARSTRRVLEVGSTGYLNPATQKQEGAQPTFKAGYGAESVGQWTQAKASGELMLNLKPGQSAYYFEIPEANVGTTEAVSPVQVFIGRKLENWNHLDQAWALGIWQPRFRWDYLKPETVGLTGAFATYDRQDYRVVLFATGLYVPERGVPISDDNGLLDSQSPWFFPPPNRVSIFGKNTPVRYSLQIPETQDIVFQPGASALFEVGGATGFWASAAYAYMPMNQLLLAYSKYLRIRENGNDYARVMVHPRVEFHHLASLETGYSHDRFYHWISYLGDFPKREETPSDWTSQDASVSHAIAIGTDVVLLGENDGALRADLSYLRQFGGNAPDRTDASSGAIGSGGSNFEDRYPFQNAFRVGASSGLARGVSVSSSLLRDIGHAGTILSLGVQYRPAPRWQVSAGADLMGSEAPDSSPDFINRYRANDRVHGGVSYVF